MTTSEGQGEWLVLLEAELARRTARVEWDAGATERARQQFIAELEAMAARYAATAHLYPLPIDDMSPAEKLACHLLPESMRPAGLPTEPAIWAEYEALRDAKR
jgi:hypothetical protein